MIRRNILIFNSGGLGDFILSWPLGLALGRLYPQSRIIYITQSSKGELAAAALGLDWRDAEGPWSALYADATRLDEKINKTLAESQSIYTFIAAPGDAFCHNVKLAASEAMVLTVRLAPSPQFKGHVAENLIQQISPQPIVSSAVRQILSSIANRGLGMSARAGGPILIHPGSGSREKCWPVPGFVELVAKLAKAHREVKIVLGEVELERFSQAEIRMLEAAGQVVRPKRYLDLYNECLAAAGFIGNDSGPAHLAGIIGLPTLALFGPSDAAVWRPLGPRVAVLQHSPLAGLPADDVLLAWNRMIDTVKQPSL